MKARVFHCFFALLITGAMYANAQSVRGVVTDALSRKPVVGATVTLMGINNQWLTDSTGSYASDTVKPGSYTLKVEAPNHLKVAKRVIIASPREAGTSDLEVNLQMFTVQTSADAQDGSMVIQYSFPGHQTASIDISDSKGKVVKNAFDRTRTGGMRSYVWNGTDNNGKLLVPGRYNAKVVSGRLVMIRTLVWKGKLSAPVK